MSRKSKYAKIPLPLVEAIYITVAVKNQRGDQDAKSIQKAMKEFSACQNEELVEQKKQLLDLCDRMLPYVQGKILSTPTGKDRERFTEFNIYAETIIRAIKK